MILAAIQPLDPSLLVRLNEKRPQDEATFLSTSEPLLLLPLLLPLPSARDVLLRVGSPSASQALGKALPIQSVCVMGCSHTSIHFRWIGITI